MQETFIHGYSKMVLDKVKRLYSAKKSLIKREKKLAKFACKSESYKICGHAKKTGFTKNVLFKRIVFNRQYFLSL